MTNTENAIVSKTISFNEEQTMLLDTAMEFCRNESPLADVRNQFLKENRFDEKRWQAMADLGWLSIAIPEDFGGLGLSLADVVPVIESMGRQLMASPFLSSTLTAQAILNSNNETLKSAWLPKIAAGSVASLALQEEGGDWNLNAVEASATVEGDNYKLKGNKTFVLDAEVAELIVISVLIDGKAELLAVESSAIPKENIKREVVIDETRASYQIKLDGICVSQSVRFDTACFQAIENAALLLISAESAGGIASVLNTIVEYLTNRKQFGKLIGSYQALKHPTVDILGALEEARSLVYHAATIYDAGDDKALEVALRMAKAAIAESFAFAGDRAIQFHGGFGFTYDCDAQLFSRRAIWAEHQFGDARHHRQLLAPLLLT